MASVVYFNSLPHNPDFYQPWDIRLLKTSWEKEKMLYHNAFNPSKDKNHHFKYFYFVICNCFQFGPV